MTEPTKIPLDPKREMAAICRDLLRDFSRATDRAADRIATFIEEEIEKPVTGVRSVWARKVLRLPGIGLEQGMTTKEISAEIGLDDEPNAEKVLAGLEKDGRIERVPGASPKRWRLNREQRRNRILRVSRLVPSGRWTTYGEIAIAVSGSSNVARAVGRVARFDPTFANPHRVLASPGVIREGWEDDEGNGPEVCEQRLAEEGVRLTDGRAPRELRISHDELAALLAASELDEDGESVG